MLDLFQTPFKGFGAEDFDAYTPEKWSSRLFTRARMGVRDKLAGIGREVAPRLAGVGADLTCDTTDPRPSVFNQNRVDAQWLFFSRSEAARRELSTIVDRKHTLADNLRDAAHEKGDAVLAVKVHQGGVEVMLGVHGHAWVDARNGARKLEDEWKRERFDTLLEALRGSAQELSLTGPGGVTAVADLTATIVHDELSAISDASEWFVLGRNFAPDGIEVMSSGFARTVGDTFVALLPIYDFLAWSRQNDYVALKAELSDVKAFVKRDGVELGPGDEVHVLSGLFSGKHGVVQEVDKKGMARVAIGKLVVQIKGTALKQL